MSKRFDGRRPDQLRPYQFQKHIAPHALGSVLAKCGNTEVICAVSVEESVPRWMKEQQVTGGWLTAEYSMLPYSTLDRKARDITKGRLDGRSVEIQRLIGRSIRAVVDLEALGQRTLCIDCDVLRADGGTRTTAITGAYVALELAVAKLIQSGKIKKSPLIAQLGAVSVGIFEGRPLLDLNYVEDKDAEVDMNIVMTSKGEFVELQATGEESTYTEADLLKMMALAKKGMKEIFKLQKASLSK
ncbi:MAG: ribonuclease PH [Verrucomicrobiota bacterium]